MEEKLSVLALSDMEKSVFRPEFYSKYLTQVGIGFYNEVLANIRSRANLYAQKHQIKLPQPKNLYKLIGAQAEKKVPFDMLTSDEQFHEMLEKVIAESDQSLEKIAQLLEQIWEGKCDLSQIFLSKTALNQISNRYFASWHTLLEKGVEQ